MLKVPGYRNTELIYQNSRSLVYRAQRESDQQAVILKTIVSELVPLPTIARYRYAASIIAAIKHHGISRLYELNEEMGRPVWVTEDIGARGLQLILQEKELVLETVLLVGIKVSEALAFLHRNTIVHKDIKPSNIVFNESTQQVNLIDFLLSSRVVEETPEWGGPEQLEGTLAYAAPEQTGRMNRQVDHRADLYSLGVTLYELLTGRLPFEETDIMSLVHAHMAVAPRPPHIIRDSIPEQLSNIVMKLLSKMPEQRYQSAFGLQADLEQCLQQLSASGTIHSFALASKDIFPRLRISKKIYGRERETRTLLDAFERVRHGASELFLISGFAGTGKTALVRELYAPITASHGRLIQGKFDALQNQPHAGLLHALGQLVREVMAMPEADFNFWRSRLREVVGNVGQALIELLPEVEQIIGKQPALDTLTGTDAQSRLQRLIQRFLQTFAAPESPLVLFLDDLQWASTSSMQMLFEMVQAGATQHILFIGTYRSNEVSEGHPLAQQLAALRNKVPNFHEIFLESLSEEAVNRWVADTLAQSAERTALLTEEIYHKTKGNPFFFERFMSVLFEEKMLYLDDLSSQWKWRLSRIQKVGFTASVADLMAHELYRLPETVRQLLGWAACLGGQFDLKILALLTDIPLQDLAEQLWPAIKEEFLIPVGSSYRLHTLSLEELQERGDLPVAYRFIHDRLREAVLALLSAETRIERHYQIGQFLLEHSDDEKQPEQIFAIVNQWNHCLPRFQTRKQRELLARLNLQAGKRAMDGVAAQEAIQYLTTGTTLLGDDDWQAEHPLAYELSFLCISAAQILGNYELSVQSEERALALAKTKAEKIAVYSLRMNRYAMTAAAAEIPKTSWDIMTLFVDRPESPKHLQAMADQEWKVVEAILQERSIASLIDLPVLTDSEINLEIQAFASVAYLFVWVPELQPFALGRAIRLSMQHGNSVDTPYTYMTHAVVLATMGDYEQAWEFAQLALAINEKFNDTESFRHARLLHMSGHLIQVWHHPVEEALSHTQRAIEMALEHGNIDAAGYSTAALVWLAIGRGAQLEELLAIEQHVIQSLTQMNFLSMLPLMALLTHSTCILAGKPEVGEALNAQGMLEEPILEQFVQVFPPAARDVYYRRVERFLLLDELDKALADAEAAAQTPGLPVPTIPTFYWHYSIVLAQLYPTVDVETQKKYLATMQSNLEQLRFFCSLCSHNCEHQMLHIEAEIAWLQGGTEAESLFERAVQSAQKYRRVNAEALILERTAHYYQALGKERVARAYLVDACNAYSLWGAKAKTTLLKKQYPHLFSQSRTSLPALHEGLCMDSSHNDSGGIQEKELDLYSILQANQSISEEIELDRLLQTMISVVVKNAGAESGLLLLPRNGELWIEAKLDNLLAEPVVNQSLPLDEEQLATRVVRFVARSKERVVLDDASQSEQFANDPYIAKQHTRSLLCSPLLKHNRLVGILYLENNKAPYIFTERRCVVLDMLSSQIAVSVDNARLYANLEGKVAERTEKLEQALQELKTKHQQLQEAQVHLVQSEKMASLGTLVAGVAHELNNPCSYSYTGANLLKDRLQGFKDLLFNMLDSQSEPDIVEMFDKEFERMFGNLEPIIDGTSQIRKIVEGLKAFSRLDEAEFKYAQIVDNLKATISIIEANYRRQVNFVCEFDVEPELECWPAQLNQAFINVMLNAVQAIMMKQKKVGLVDTGAGVVEKGTIRIRTFAENGHWGIQFVDDGCGMSEKIKSRIFEPFFTTRAVGEGAGLGLSITFGIINKHNGSIAVESEPGKGTAFTIYLPKEISA